MAEKRGSGDFSPALGGRGGGARARWGGRGANTAALGGRAGRHVGVEPARREL